MLFSQLLQEGGGGGGLGTLGFDLPSLIVYLVNFVILLVILYVAAYKPFLRMMDERSTRIKEGLEAAERAKEELGRIQADMQQKLAEARREGSSCSKRPGRWPTATARKSVRRHALKPRPSSNRLGKTFSVSAMRPSPRFGVSSPTWPFAQLSRSSTEVSTLRHTRTSLKGSWRKALI